MTKTIDTYLALVRAALGGTQDIEIPAELNQEALQIHMRQGTATMVFPLLPMTPAMKMVCVQNMQQHVKLHHTLSLAWNALEKAGVQAVLMKGASLAAMYPDPQMRTWGDIDLFVGKDQYHPACAAMRDTFPNALKFDEELDHYKHYNLIADGVSIEIHRVTMGLQHPLDECRYAKMEADAVAHACDLKIGDLNVRIFEPTFNALFVLFHSWEHMMTQGANVRQLCDVALLLHHYAGQIDGTRLKKNLRALHLTDVWQLYMWILVNALGLPQAEAPLYTDRVAERAERLLTDLLNNKMVAPKPTGKAPQNRVLRKFHTMQERLRDASRMATYSPAYARHLYATTLLHGALRFFAKDRRWE